MPHSIDQHCLVTIWAGDHLASSEDRTITISFLNPEIIKLLRLQPESVLGQSYVSRTPKARSTI